MPNFKTKFALAAALTVGLTQQANAHRIIQDGSGKMTYFDPHVAMGTCALDPLSIKSYPWSPAPNDIKYRHTVALSYKIWNDAASCGTCLNVSGPKGNIIVRVTDKCATCEEPNHIDLSQDAFAKIADVEKGVVPVSWKVVSCSDDFLEGNTLSYVFKEGSGPYWSAIQIRNHIQGISQFEIKSSGTNEWQMLSRSNDNHFICHNNCPTKFDARVMFVDGTKVVDDDILMGSFEGNPRVVQGQTNVGAASNSVQSSLSGSTGTASTNAGSSSGQPQTQSQPENVIAESLAGGAEPVNSGMANIVSSSGQQQQGQSGSGSSSPAASASASASSPSESSSSSSAPSTNSPSTGSAPEPGTSASIEQQSADTSPSTTDPTTDSTTTPKPQEKPPTEKNSGCTGLDKYSANCPYSSAVSVSKVSGAVVIGVVVGVVGLFL